MIEKSIKASEKSPIEINVNACGAAIPRPNGFIVIGHRGCNGATSHLSGASSEYRDVPPHMMPENTLHALHADMFDYSNEIIDLRDGNEFDVYNTKDGIPVICHDDALNLNVAGANRNERELGCISELTLSEVFRHNVGQRKIIPPLETALISLGTFNISRQAMRLSNIIFNIELKGPQTALTVYPIAQRVIAEIGRIAHEDIVYCSSNLGELRVLRSIAPYAQIAFAVNTEQFFGKENVLEGFIVPMKLPYRQDFFAWLDHIHQEIRFNAIDCTFWDINSQLIHYAQAKGIGIHTTLANFMDFNVVLIDHLIDLHKQLGNDSNNRSRLHFKTDCPGHVKKIMMERLMQPDPCITFHGRLENSVSCQPAPTSRSKVVRIISREKRLLTSARPYMGSITGEYRLPRPHQTPELEAELLAKKFAQEQSKLSPALEGESSPFNVMHSRVMFPQASTSTIPSLEYVNTEEWVPGSPLSCVSPAPSARSERWSVSDLSDTCSFLNIPTPSTPCTSPFSISHDASNRSRSLSFASARSVTSWPNFCPSAYGNLDTPLSCIPFSTPIPSPYMTSASPLSDASAGRRLTCATHCFGLRDQLYQHNQSSGISEMRDRSSFVNRKKGRDSFPKDDEHKKSPKIFSLTRDMSPAVAYNDTLSLPFQGREVRPLNETSSQSLSPKRPDNITLLSPSIFEDREMVTPNAATVVITRELFDGVRRALHSNHETAPSWRQSEGVLARSGSSNMLAQSADVSDSTTDMHLNLSVLTTLPRDAVYFGRGE